MKGRPVRERLGFAAAGLREAYARESSFRIHCRVALATLAVLLLLRPAPIWWALIATLAGLVLAFELMNSALEGFIDLVFPDVHPTIKVVKDMAAGAVLVIGLAALAVAGCMIAETVPLRLVEWGWRRLG